MWDEVDSKEKCVRTLQFGSNNKEVYCDICNKTFFKSFF